MTMQSHSIGMVRMNKIMAYVATQRLEIKASYQFKDRRCICGSIVTNCENDSLKKPRYGCRSICLN